VNEDRLQRAVSFTIASGYQLNARAFDFLNVVSKIQDPVEVMKEAIRRTQALPDRPLFIDRDLLEEATRKLSPELEEEKAKPPAPPSGLLGAKRVFHAYAEGVDSSIRVIDDPTDRLCTSGTIDDYLGYFQDRFKRMRKLLNRRMDTKDARLISEALKAPVNSKVKIIGMVTDRRESKQRIFLRFEDLDASVTVLVPQNVTPEVMERARALLLDQVVCVSAVKGRDDLLIAEDFILPDVPRRTPNKAPVPAYVALISDLHVGSKMFMREEFNRFLLWLNGRFGNTTLRKMASHVKYVIIAGDLVDGIGIYPNQLKELAIRDIYEQYRRAAKFLEQIPDYIELIIIPGNHDASRKALPQPALPRDCAEPLREARAVHSLGNPCTISLHGVELLVYHGRSLDDIASVVPNVSFQTPEKAMRCLLKSRHLAPIYGEKTPIAPEGQDFMVIERIPDIFHAGHVHVMRYDAYRGTLLANSGAWQERTPYQRKMGLDPTPGIIPVVNLQTLQVRPVDFTASYS
jgi:DNA polymerase II small subunit